MLPSAMSPDPLPPSPNSMSRLTLNEPEKYVMLFICNVMHDYLYVLNWELIDQPLNNNQYILKRQNHWRYQWQKAVKFAEIKMICFVWKQWNFNSNVHNIYGFPFWMPVEFIK